MIVSIYAKSWMNYFDEIVADENNRKAEIKVARGRYL